MRFLHAENIISIHKLYVIFNVYLYNPNHLWNGCLRNKRVQDVDFITRSFTQHWFFFLTNFVRPRNRRFKNTSILIGFDVKRRVSEIWKQIFWSLQNVRWIGENFTFYSWYYNTNTRLRNAQIYIYLSKISR